MSREASAKPNIITSLFDSRSSVASSLQLLEQLLGLEWEFV